jgi:uncharacterized protein YodC (DUF2158 family)
MAPGDVVVLKSGSLLMTISQIKDKEALCIWFLNGDLKQGFIKVECLEPYKGPKNDVIEF